MRNVIIAQKSGAKCCKLCRGGDVSIPRNGDLRRVVQKDKASDRESGTENGSI